MTETEHDSGIRTTPSSGLVLLFATLLMAICGLIYELLAGALSSYLLGDSVSQFSVVIGWFLTALGVGSYLSKYILTYPLTWLIGCEIAVGFLGGCLAAVGFAAFALTNLYTPILLGMTGIIGVLVGLEIPLVIRLLRSLHELRLTVAHVLSADYIGALVAAVAFPFLLLPHLGLTRAGMAAGMANLLIAGALTWYFKSALQGRHYQILTTCCALAFTALVAGFFISERLVTYFEDRLYEDRVIYARNSKFQRVILTRWREDLRLYLNGHLQFSSIDEYRYHEPLVHIPLAMAERRHSVLILGGGDGLAAREVAKYAEVERIQVVDLDPVITEIFSRNTLLTRLNQNVFRDPRVEILNADAMHYLRNTNESFDVILMDLPDPSDPVLGKLYSRGFYSLAARHLRSGGVMATQATSPFRSRAAFWCVQRTMDSARFEGPLEGTLEVLPYHVLVPTFGEWGFVVAGRKLPALTDLTITLPARFLTQEIVPSLFLFPPDMSEIPGPISTLDDPVIVRLYRQGYHQYFE